MKIIFGIDRIDVDRRTFRAWLPQLPYAAWFDGDDFVDDLANRIQGRYGIKRHHIGETLHWFFKILQRYSGAFEGQTRMRVAGVLITQLKKDLPTSWEPKDLRSSRHGFLILAYLASEYESVLLAEALDQFWLQALQYIAQIESSKHLEDWQKGLEEIRELLEGPAAMDVGARAMVPYAGLHRGRSPRALALPWAGHRARSSPAIRHRYNTDMRLAIPAYASSAWNSPMVSPVEYPRNGYFEELDNLYYQQSEMNMKLDNVDGKLNLLLAGFST